MKGILYIYRQPFWNWAKCVLSGAIPAPLPPLALLVPISSTSFGFWIHDLCGIVWTIGPVINCMGAEHGDPTSQDQEPVTQVPCGSVLVEDSPALVGAFDLSLLLDPTVICVCLLFLSSGITH